MEKAEVKYKTVNYISCPFCNNFDFEISKISEFKDASMFPIVCPECKNGFKSKFINDELHIKKLNETKINGCIDFLKYGNILLLLKGVYINYDLDLNRRKKFFDKECCPAAYLSKTIEIVDMSTGEPDPHGIFEFIESIPIVEDYSYENIIKEMVEKHSL
jgi:hypothetical protein